VILCDKSTSCYDVYFEVSVFVFVLVLPSNEIGDFFLTWHY